ncbi:MAG: type I secretion protein [Thalassovita sp.]
MPLANELLGTGLSDTIEGTRDTDQIQGLSGNDTLEGRAGADHLFGDYADENLLSAGSAGMTLTEFGNSGHWQVTNLDNGHQQMVQSVSTEAGGVYQLNLDLAANFAAGITSGGIEIRVDGVLVSTLETQSGAFAEQMVQFTATGANSEISIRSIAGPQSGPEIDTSGAVYSYQSEVQIDGAPVTVSAFADGQSNLYQVLNGTMHVFDTETETYAQVGVDGAVNVNAIGFNQQDNLIYGTAVGEGTDALGVQVSRSDLVMFDATGAVYRIGEAPFRSWTGDFDDQGNLWSFHSSLDRVAVVDVDTLDANGNPVSTEFQLPAGAFPGNVYDLSYDAATQSFTGVERPSQEGAPATLVRVDISSGAPEVSTLQVVSTQIGDTIMDGVPRMTFGAAIYDGDGNLFVGGNNGDHDMNDATGNSGGIYRVEIDAQSNTARLVLITAAPGSYSNDGAADPRALSPFAQVDLQADVLLRDLRLVATVEGELSYDDHLVGGGGTDTLEGGIGEDMAIGGSRGDSLMGGDGNDQLYGGSGPDAISDGRYSVYDLDGTRYDQFGNLLMEDDDILYGGDGTDMIDGGAGHDTLDGGAGADTLQGGSGFDVLFGGDADDVLSGGGQRDTLDGGNGADVLQGATGDDLLRGGAGNDDLQGGSDTDTLLGQEGDDLLNGGSGSDRLSGGQGADSMIGGSGDDVMSGDGDNDTLLGGSGQDLLEGGTGADQLRGGTGNDTLEGGEGRDRLNGGSGDDVVNGGDGRDNISGAGGNDVLNGGAGRDSIYLGAGSDIASGGADADRFVFRTDDLSGGTDVILDYSVTERDRFDLRQLDLQDVAQWFANNVTLDAAGDTHVTLGDTTVTLEQTGATLDQLYDSFLF